MAHVSELVAALDRVLAGSQLNRAQAAEATGERFAELLGSNRLKESLSALRACVGNSQCFNAVVTVAGFELACEWTADDEARIAVAAALHHGVPRMLGVAPGSIAPGNLMTMTGAVLAIAAAREVIGDPGPSGLDLLAHTMITFDRIAYSTPGWGVAVPEDDDDDDGDDRTDTRHVVGRLFLDTAALFVARRWILRSRDPSRGRAAERAESALRTVLESSRRGSCIKRARAMLVAIVQNYG
jgi:hypothetical protein